MAGDPSDRVCPALALEGGHDPDLTAILAIIQANPELALVVTAWDKLPSSLKVHVMETIKAGLPAIIKASHRP
jgi:hypothetical protein